LAFSCELRLGVRWCVSISVTVRTCWRKGRRSSIYTYRGGIDSVLESTTTKANANLRTKGRGVCQDLPRWWFKNTSCYLSCVVCVERTMGVRERTRTTEAKARRGEARRGSPAKNKTKKNRNWFRSDRERPPSDRQSPDFPNGTVV
jgi:hypothetical protein